MHILFVCSGNTCRSPMAQALLTQQLKMKNMQLGDAVIAQSAGLYATDGQPASREAIKVMAEMGIDISGHQAQALNNNLLQWADLILTMTMDHYQGIIRKYDISSSRIYTLAEFSRGVYADVMDPFASGIQTYRQCARQINSMIEEIIKKIS